MNKNVISADDPQALEKLRARLEKLEADQKEMRAANAYYRKNKTLDDCPGLPPAEIERLKDKMARHRTDKPYSSYELSGNNAEIRRNKGRIAQLERQAEFRLDLRRRRGPNRPGGKPKAGQGTDLRAEAQRLPLGTQHRRLAAPVERQRDLGR